jgi:hypothetical protein
LLNKAGCKEAFNTEDGVSVDNNFPYGLFAQQNFANGNKYNVCLTCSNQDETVFSNIEIDQADCGTAGSKPCPQATPAKDQKKGSCSGSLKPIEKPN